MDDLIKRNEITTLDYLSLFDEQFSVEKFGEDIKKADKESESIIDATKRAIQKAAANQKDDKDYKLVVQLEDDMKAALDNGDIKLVTNDTGEVFAQIRNSNGRFGSRLPIKKELEEEGISADGLQMALQMDIIKEQLKAIVETMQTIEGRVTAVLQGQHNDRIGLFYSGMSLYAESRSIKDSDLKRQVTAQALRALSDANAQMIQEIRTSVSYLVTEQYKNAKKITASVEEHLGIIHQCYDVVYRASFMKAAIYQQRGEIEAMLTAIDEYGRFVEKLIIPYAGKLTELDKNSSFIETGTWGTIAGTLVSCSDIKKRISNCDTFYLEMGGDNNG